VGIRSAENAGGVDALGVPELEKCDPERVLANGGDVAHSRPLPRGSDGTVRGVASKSGKVVFYASDLIQLHQGFAETEQVQ
jgi:hypothetical protein